MLHPSDSSEQRLAEIQVLASLNKELNLNLISAPVIVNNTLFQLDGYSEDPPVLCEIYSRIGKLKPAQKNKINKDILKMLLIEKMMLRTPLKRGSQAQHDKDMPKQVRHVKLRKIIAFADEEAAKSFTSGESWYSKLKDYFGIEIIAVKISQSLREELLKAQERQYR